jgi:hypothetical protein
MSILSGQQHLVQASLSPAPTQVTLYCLLSSLHSSVEVLLIPLCVACAPFTAIPAFCCCPPPAPSTAVLTQRHSAAPRAHRHGLHYLRPVRPGYNTRPISQHCINPLLCHGEPAACTRPGQAKTNRGGSSVRTDIWSRTTPEYRPCLR